MNLNMIWTAEYLRSGLQGALSNHTMDGRFVWRIISMFGHSVLLVMLLLEYGMFWSIMMPRIQI